VSTCAPGSKRQHGAVILLLVALLLLGGALFTYSSFNVATVRVDRERVTNEVLTKAKDALIAYAAADSARPGQLPCPDVNDDGIEDLAGACTNLIGRLPWVTLGLPDLRDDSGGRLWYAVSTDFGNGSAVPLNSDTAFRSTHQSLTLNGTTPAANLAALVIAPGATLTRTDGRAQVRGCGATCDPRDFLDIASGEDNVYENRIFVAAPRSGSFNDTLMPVFSDDIMRLVERRAARELAQHLRNHYDAWSALAGAPGYSGFKGFYPYAVPLVDPSAPAQAGSNGTMNGMLPLTATPLTWSNASANCSGNGTSTLDCTQLVLCVIICLTNFSARIDNVATRFVDPPSPAAVTVLGVALAGSPTWSLNAAQGRLDFSYNGGVVAIGIARILVSAPPASSWLGTSWLTANNWHQNAFYGVSSGYALTGGGACGGVTPCLTIASTAMPNANKHAVVAMSGRALPAQSARPVSMPANVGEFLEGLNADANLTQFGHNVRSPTFNDTVIAVRP
jgi:hypothetical protein